MEDIGEDILQNRSLPGIMMNVSERQKMETINTPYDDTFRTLLQDCPELVVPLINELFGTNYNPAGSKWYRMRT